MCYGDFLDPKAAFRSNVPPMIKPKLWKNDDLKGCKPHDSFIKKIAAHVLLPPGEVEIWT